MKKLFVEIDEAEEGRLITLRRMMSFMENEGSDENKWNFDKVIANAADEVLETWEAIKEYDQIYMDTALINSYFNIGSGNMFNMLMHRAIEENVIGKELFIFRDFKGINWDNLKSELVQKVFIGNKIHSLEDKEDGSHDKYWKLITLEELLQETV